MWSRYYMVICSTEILLKQLNATNWRLISTPWYGSTPIWFHVLLKNLFSPADSTSLSSFYFQCDTDGGCRMPWLEWLLILLMILSDRQDEVLVQFALNLDWGDTKKKKQLLSISFANRKDKKKWFQVSLAEPYHEVEMRQNRHWMTHRSDYCQVGM